MFLFLYRQSRVVYFGLWAVAWVLRVPRRVLRLPVAAHADTPAGWRPTRLSSSRFVIVLISAARAGFASDMKDWRTVLRLIAILPIFVALVWAIGQSVGTGGVPRFARRRARVRVLVQLLHAAAAAGHGQPDLPLLAAGAGRRRSSSMPSFWLTCIIAAARPRGRVTCTTRRIPISRCTACWHSPPWRCGVRARSTACATWPANWITCAASARRRWIWTA